ncbi:MAG: ATP-binding cassette domain-containing protein, partial [Gammaproteobacteria bacterium]
MPPELLLRARDISYTRGGNRILDRVSFDLPRAKITTIIGPNGAGKSTLTGIVTGLIDQFSGEIERAPGLRIGYLPQKVYVNPLMPLNVERLMHLTRRAKDTEIDAAL